MIDAVKFGYKLLMLNLGASFPQLVIKDNDHKKLYKGKRIPLSVSISCTFHCNLNCRHCASEINNNKEDVFTTERFLKLIDEIAAAGAVKIGFTGGEPLMREDMGEILERCYENKLLVSLASNGWLVPKYVNKLKKLSVLLLSLDGNKEVHDYIRGKGSWDRFLEAVAIAKKNKIPVIALTNLNAMNYEVFRQFPDIFKRLKINWMVGAFSDTYGIGLNANLPPGERREGSDYSISQDDTNRMIDYISKSKNLRTSKKYLEFMQGKTKMPRCYAGIGYCVISPYGKLYPCFQSSFDSTYEGVNVLGKNFKDAFSEMPLYRKCDICDLNCHIEANYIYEFNPNAMLNAYRAMRK